jgi:hypothetical protein
MRQEYLSAVMKLSAVGSGSLTASYSHKKTNPNCPYVLPEEKNPCNDYTAV